MQHSSEHAQRILQAIEKLFVPYSSFRIGVNISIRATILILGTVGPITYAIAKYIIHRLYFHPLAAVPGPHVSWIPFLGNMPETVFGDRSAIYKKWAKEYGGLVCFHGTLNSPRILVTDPLLLKQVLTTHQYDFSKPPNGIATAKRIFGDSIISTEGESHQRLRKILNPMFHMRQIRELVPLMFVPPVQLVHQWISKIQAEQTAGDEPVEIIVSSGISSIALDIIGLTGLGHEFNSVRHCATEEVSKISWGYQTLFNSDKRSILTLMAMIFPVLRFVPTKRFQEVDSALKAIHEESMDVVQKCIERVKSKKAYKETHLLASMAQLSESGTGVYKFTTDEMRVQSLSLLVAGRETTAASLSWCLWLLAQHQGIQDALRAEITPLFQHIRMEHPVFHDNPFKVGFDGANLPTITSINNLRLLDNVLRESLRLFPTVPITARHTVKDTVMKGYHIPKGTYVYVPIIVSHHNKNFWGEDAENFRPSRWEEEPASNVGPYDFMPYLAGGRQCLGKRLADAEMKITLATLLMNFQFFEKPGFAVTKLHDITLRPAPNMTLLVKPVKMQKQ